MNAEINVNVNEVDVTNQVTMTDGRVVEFSKRSRANKDIVDNGDGTFTIVMDFKNGETRKYSIEHCALILYAKHGALQKFGDTFNAFGKDEDIDDAIVELDDMHLRINRGEWTAQRTAGEAKGGSMLLAALIEHLGIAREKVQNYLSNLDNKKKFALMASAELSPIIARIKQEKAEKAAGKGKETIDTNSLLDEIKGL